MIGRDGKGYFWLISESGGFKLPLLVTDDTKEAADYLGIKVGTIFSKMSKAGKVEYHCRNYTLTRVEI